MHICRTWRQLSSKPVVVIPNPLPSETGFGENDQPVMEIWKQCRAHGDEEALLGVFASVTAAFETEFGFTFLPQADITRHGPISTKPLYCENAVSVLNRTNDATNNAVFNSFMLADLSLGLPVAAIDEIKIYDTVFDPATQCSVVIGGTPNGAGCTLP